MRTDQIILSVVVCTYNRADLLSRLLQSFRTQAFEAQRYEIIVVDNNSTDNTSSVVKEFCCSFSNLRYFLEPQQGLSHARNRGWREARGQYVAFIDDDAQASRDWLETALHCFCRVRPEPLAIGGKILPAYDALKPKWFQDDLEVRSLGDDPRFLRSGESFSGSNMVFRRDVLENYGGFDVNVGVKGRYLSVGEETNLFAQIWQDKPDASFYYSPAMIVYHAVPEYKMTVSYSLKRSFVTGQVWMIQNSPNSLFGRIWLFARIVVSACLWIVRSLLNKRRYSGVDYWAAKCLSPVAIELGRLTGCLGLFIKVRQGDR
jgi:glycosyltransferase involved in cell wall biosynthesis